MQEWELVRQAAGVVQGGAQAPPNTFTGGREGESMLDLRLWRRGRRELYRIARLMGNIQPWLEISPRLILRRAINRIAGRLMGRQIFGRGLIARLIRRII